MKKGSVFWFTGLSGAGKTTIAEAAKRVLEDKGYKVLILDGDDVRARFHADLGFSEKDIKKNNFLISELCKSSREKYDIIMVPIISPYAESRRKAKDFLGDGFYEIFIDAGFECVVSRDVKGLYAMMANGEIDNMIGFSPESPYEAPKYPDLVISSGKRSQEDSVKEFLDFICTSLKEEVRQK
ncbi:MAG: adenylyl-sulfate kinase [Candidatus Omnitrophica bacterium]|nr:adenylyl-sulfate kinase [Candidatus Omnitrophota bacterium]